jgi:hypothetical protein
MRRERKLLLKAAAVVGIGLAALASPQEAQADAAVCPGTHVCVNSCAEQLSYCEGCPPWYGRMCEEVFECAGGKAVWCAEPI